MFSFSVGDIDLWWVGGWRVGIRVSPDQLQARTAMKISHKPPENQEGF